MTSRLKQAGALTAAGIMAVSLLVGLEGQRERAYLDLVKKWTICNGETAGVTEGMVKTPAECRAMLVQSAIKHEQGMRACLKRPDSLPDPTYVALLSFTYNVGTGAFCRASLTRKINAGDIRGGCDGLLAWDRAGGRKVRGLTLRRQKERELCLKGLS